MHAKGARFPTHQTIRGCILPNVAILQHARRTMPCTPAMRCAPGPTVRQEVCTTIQSAVRRQPTICHLAYGTSLNLLGRTAMWCPEHASVCKRAFQTLYEIFVRNLFGVFKDLGRCTFGNNSKRALFLLSDDWESYIICSLIFKKWHRFCCARICRFIFSPARNIPPFGRSPKASQGSGCTLLQSVSSH